MKRRQFFGGAAAALAASRLAGAPGLGGPASLCDCAMLPFQVPAGAEALRGYGSKVKITDVKVFGVSISKESDRPYVFVKLETDAGLVGWGEGTLEGKAAAVMACVNDFRDFLIGADPLPVEHHWQSMYVHSFYRAGPVMGSAIAGIDQAFGHLAANAKAEQRLVTRTHFATEARFRSRTATADFHGFDQPGPGGCGIRLRRLFTAGGQRKNENEGDSAVH